MKQGFQAFSKKTVLSEFELSVGNNYLESTKVQDCGLSKYHGTISLVW